MSKFQCPRRAGSFSATASPEDEYRSDDSCTYCGSLNPETFMARLEAGDVELGPTVKSYKVYVHNRGGARFKQTYRTDAKPFAGWESSAHDWVTREVDETKFYFQHLSDEQRARFIELFNEKRLRIGYPGHFYVLPFFTRPTGSVH